MMPSRFSSVLPVYEKNHFINFKRFTGRLRKANHRIIFPQNLALRELVT